MAFLPSGAFNYVEDRNGNTLSAVDTNGLLSGLFDASTGETDAITLDAQGKISQITEPTGQVIAYVYDSTSKYLQSVTTNGQTTSFTYVTGSTPQRNNAVASITSPDGVTGSFTYDSLGRLIETSDNGGAEAVTYSYNLG